MTLSHHLIGELACVINDDDRPLPVLRVRLHEDDVLDDDVVVALPEETTGYDKAPVINRPLPKTRGGIAVLEVVAASLTDVPMTARDITMALNAKGTRVNRHTVGRALRTLEGDRRATCTVLRSGRDIARAGGKLLWRRR